MEDEMIPDFEALEQVTEIPEVEPQIPEEDTAGANPAFAEHEENWLPETTGEFAEAPVAESKPKKLLKKWWFWVIVVAVIALLVVGIVALTDGGSSGSGSGSSGGGSSVTSYVNPYVQIVKTTENSNYGITYGKAFDSFFTSPSWDYFKATTGEHVVEFEGGFLYDGKPATATIQFVLDLDEGMLQVYHLSINGVAQNKLMLSAMIKKVFESY